MRFIIIFLQAVQLAKQAGNQVIGTVSSDEKAKLLKSVGCDRVVNYKKEDLGKVLKKEYPKGVDIVYESVGGELYKAALENLAIKGKLIVIGIISGYQSGEAFSKSSIQTPIESLLLQKSASVRGFLVLHYAHLFPQYLFQLAQMVAENKVKGLVDNTPFYGLEQIPDAIDFMYSGKNSGKIVVHAELTHSKL